jgi:hypothetical protein
MFSVVSLVGAVGSRAFRHQPPRGTSSRILRLRLQRQFHQGILVRQLCSPATTESYADRDYESESPREAYALLNDDVLPVRHSNHASSASRTSVQAKQLPGTLERLLRAVQTQDVHDTWVAMKKLAEVLGSEAKKDLDVEASLIELPQPTFSEILRCLDPVCLGPLLDSSAGLMIPASLAHFSSTGAIMNEYGIRKLYTMLLDAMLKVFPIRLAAGQRLILSDYKVLLRCAGAASNPRAAKAIWKAMPTSARAIRMRTDMYDEYIKARFLTEPLYFQNDLSRLRVRPRNLHGPKTTLPGYQLERLDHLRLSMRAHKTNSYGLDPYHQGENEDGKMQDLVRIIRMPRPIRRVWLYLSMKGVAIDERLLCSGLKAFGWTASILEIRRLLRNHLKIHVQFDRETGAASISGGKEFAADSPLRPTDRLLQAIVQALGANAEIALASKLVDFISRRYGIKISNHTWSGLLSWTYLSASKGVATEWKVLGYPRKVIEPKQVLLVWQAMTSSQGHPRPSFQNWDIYIKTLIEIFHFRQAITQMREARAYYYEVAKQHDEAVFQRVLASYQNVIPTQAKHQYDSTKVLKHLYWHNIQLWCYKLLKTAGRHKYSRERDFMRFEVQQFVQEFYEFMPNPITYRIASGRVQLAVPEANIRFQWTPEISKPPPTGLRVPIWQEDEEGLRSVVGKRTQIISRPVARMARKRRATETSKKLPWRRQDVSEFPQAAIEKALVW